MRYNVYFEIKGLYPEERDYILARLELIKDKICRSLLIECTRLKSSPNRVSCEYSSYDLQDAVRLYSLLDSIAVPNIRTEYDDYIPLDDRDVPYVRLLLNKCGRFSDYNVDKGRHRY